MTKIDRQIAEQLFDPKRKVSWRDFVKTRMGPYMRKYGGHGPAIRQIAKEWKEYNKKRVMVKTKSKHKSKSKSKSGSWLDFVKSHKHLRTARGLIDLKAISKLWKMKTKAYDPGWNKGRKNTLWNRVTGYRRQEPIGGRMEIQDVKSHQRRTYDPASKRQKRYSVEYTDTANSTEVHRYTIYAKDSKEARYKFFRLFPNVYWVGIHETTGLDTKRPSFYDPAPKHGLSKPPSNWYHAMLQGIKKSSDVRTPGAIVGSIWRKLSPSKKSDIKAREAKGERFQYDLPLPDDRPTRGTGTLRMVKPFKLAEVQVNLSVKDYMAALKSGLFSRMKRNDGTIALVARCKSEKKNCNIFVDKG